MDGEVFVSIQVGEFVVLGVHLLWNIEFIHKKRNTNDDNCAPLEDDRRFILKLYSMMFPHAPQNLASSSSSASQFAQIP